MTVRLGLTMGDPAGIGPEIVLAAARDLAPRVAAGEFALAVIGTPRCFEEIARRLGIGAEIAAGDDAVCLAARAGDRGGRAPRPRSSRASSAPRRAASPTPRSSARWLSPSPARSTPS